MKKRGKTIVLVTHKANLLALSDKTLMMVNGQIEKFGPTREIFAQQAAHQQAKQAAKQKKDEAEAKEESSAVVNMPEKPRA